MVNSNGVIKLKMELFEFNVDKVTLRCECFDLITTNKDRIMSILKDVSKGLDVFEVTFKLGKIVSIKGVGKKC